MRPRAQGGWTWWCAPHAAHKGGTEPCLGHPLPTPLQELYTEPYETINWYAARNNVASVDLYAPHTTVLDVLYSA